MFNNKSLGTPVRDAGQSSIVQDPALATQTSTGGTQHALNSARGTGHYENVLPLTSITSDTWRAYNLTSFSPAVKKPVFMAPEPKKKSTETPKGPKLPDVSHDAKAVKLPSVKRDWLE